MDVLRVLWLVMFVCGAVADYGCICNYNIEESVRNSPSSSASAIGYMYEFDCKQNIPMTSLDKGWLAVAFEHHLGYVEAGSAVQLQTCQGSPPVDDIVTTTTSATPTPTTSTVTTSTLALSTPTSTTSPTTQMTTAKSTTSTTSPTTQATTLKPATTTTASTTIQPTTTRKQTTATTTKSTITTTTLTTQRSTATTQSTTTPIPTTTPKPTTTTKRATTQTPTTPLPSITTTTTTTQTTIGVSNPCSFVSTHYKRLVKGKLTSYGKKCYEIVTQSVAWPTAEHDCNSKGGHLVHIANTAEQNFIYNYLKTNSPHRVWIGLTDHRNEEKFEWTSGDPITYTHWAPNRYTFIHILEDCVELDPNNNGFWKDKDCQTAFQAHYGYVCQYQSGASVPVTSAPLTSAPLTHRVTTASHSLDGNTHLCRSQNQQHAQTRGTYLAQYGSSCYELMPRQKMTWQHAEQVCESGHGHLAHISSAGEQTFIQGFMQRHMPQHAVWIGLHDLRTEGHYEWTSGNAVRYTNFVSNHIGNYESRFQENCFAFIPYKNGQWDDIDCGHSGFFSDSGEIHPVLCQFPTVHTSIIG